jgi:hypothetical protein
MELPGGFTFDEDIGRIVGPNITADKEVGIGSWSPAQIVPALRDGTRPWHNYWPADAHRSLPKAVR